MRMQRRESYSLIPFQRVSTADQRSASAVLQQQQLPHYRRAVDWLTEAEAEALTVAVAVAGDVEGVVIRWRWRWRWRSPSDFCATFAGRRLGFTYLICLCRLNANDLDNDINRQKKKTTASGTRNERRFWTGTTSATATEMETETETRTGTATDSDCDCDSGWDCVVWIVNLTAFEGSFVSLAPQSSCCSSSSGCSQSERECTCRRRRRGSWSRPWRSQLVQQCLTQRRFWSMCLKLMPENQNASELWLPVALAASTTSTTFCSSFSSSSYRFIFCFSRPSSFVVHLVA